MKFETWQYWVLFSMVYLFGSSSAQLNRQSEQVFPNTAHDEELSEFFDKEYQSEGDFIDLRQIMVDIQKKVESKFYGPDTKPRTPPNPNSMVSIALGQPGLKLQTAQYLFEGDILLTRNQARYLLRSFAATALRLKRSVRSAELYLRRRVKRKMYSDPVGHWKKFPIQYTIHKTIDKFTSSSIEEALKFYEDHTCLTFHKDQNATGDYLEFFAGSGCYSMIGYLGGRQGISLGSGCERHDEQSAEDGQRLHENIDVWHDSALTAAYDRAVNITSWEDVETFDVPYDVGSDMHYGATAFTADWTMKTITTNDPDYQRTIGQRERLSFFDIQIINKAYCSKKCSVELECQHGGYTSPSGCDHCECADGFTGTLCDQPMPSKDAKCGGALTATSRWQNISTPGYPDPGFEAGQECYWLLQAPEGRNIELEFVDQFQAMCTTTCLDYVEIKDGENMTATGKRFCCYEKPDHGFVSDSQFMMVIFRATLGRDIGMKMRFKIEGDAPVVSSKTTTESRPPTTKRSEPTQAPTTEKPSTTTETASPASVTDDAPPSVSSWMEWTGWSSCSKSCGGCGIKQRHRNCINPPCSGNSPESTQRSQFTRCALLTCPNDVWCTRINFYDAPCGPFGLQVCSKVAEVKFKCHQASCCPPYQDIGGRCDLTLADANSWSEWSDWGACIGPRCGGCAVQARHRVCNGILCSGDSTMYQRCNTQVCGTCDDPSKQKFSDFYDSCLTTESSDVCEEHRTMMLHNSFTCPCCNPLREKNGHCVP